MQRDPNLSVMHWKVLLVDDDMDNLGVAQQYFRFMGAQVEVAKDGVDGLEVLKRYTPTFILLDLSMPRMDGWEMLKELRLNPETAALPVIALTAHAMAADRERVLAAGFDGYITKPIILGTLMSGILDCLTAVSLRLQEAASTQDVSIKAAVPPVNAAQTVTPPSVQTGIPTNGSHPASAAPPQEPVAPLGEASLPGTVAEKPAPAPIPEPGAAAPSGNEQTNEETLLENTNKRSGESHVST
jgi:two-component system, cell cycle response regulator DivK